MKHENPLKKRKKKEKKRKKSHHPKHSPFTTKKKMGGDIWFSFYQPCEISDCFNRILVSCFKMNYSEFENCLHAYDFFTKHTNFEYKIK